MCGGNVTDDFVNAIITVPTAGLVKMKDGKFEAGVTGKEFKKQGNKYVTPYLKEITGASAQEDANKLAREQYDQQKKDALKDIEDARQQNAQDQLAASRQAAAVRSTSRSRSTASSRGSGGSTYNRSSLGGDERDFLGL